MVMGVVKAKAIPTLSNLSLFVKCVAKPALQPSLTIIDLIVLVKLLCNPIACKLTSPRHHLSLIHSSYHPWFSKVENAEPYTSTERIQVGNGTASPNHSLFESCSIASSGSHPSDEAVKYVGWHDTMDLEFNALRKNET
ncbi:hypothetical protein Nepgr_026450 [Nepenthes gracilis]|uniref:Uncharacterized protein n=1 Tax=Nepenthes gracilis TaxID=150966 RepID=A0AAD3T8A0_NEPGR|nr:hypothetical protein Nepgr_026450 [Nepenthes gracilis]